MFFWLIYNSFRNWLCLRGKKPEKDETLFSGELISFLHGKRKSTERECLLQKGHTINNDINSHIEQRKVSTLHIPLPVTTISSI